jgi:hypothetical protein
VLKIQTVNDEAETLAYIGHVDNVINGAIPDLLMGLYIFQETDNGISYFTRIVSWIKFPDKKRNHEHDIG